MQKEVQNLVDQKLSAIDLAEKLFKDAIKDKDDALKEVLNKWLGSLNVIDGKIDRETNRKLLNTLNKALRAKINKSTLTSPVKSLLKVFDTVENYTKKSIEIENAIDLSKYDLSEEKKQAISEITDTLLNDDVLNANVTQQLKKIAFRHVQTGISFQDAQKEFEKVLDGNPLAKYARVITAEAIHRYDGMINQRVATDYKLDAFRIVGSLISTSQPVCINMIKESGPFAGMAINGKYPIKELPAILRIVNSYPSAVPGTNESNYFINRNHWGCRHVFIPTRFTAKDLQGIPVGVINSPENPNFGFNPAANIAQSKNYLKDIFSEKTGLNIASVVYDSDLTLDQINVRNNQVYNLLNEYKLSGAVKTEVSPVLKMKSQARYFGVVKYNYDGNIREINFGSKVDANRVKQRITIDPEAAIPSLRLRYNGKSIVDKENLPVSTLTHEFAHLISFSNIKTPGPHMDFWSEMRDLKNKYTGEVNQHIKNDKEGLKEIFLGAYASTNVDEFFAEGFTEYKLNSNPSKYAKLIGSLADKYFKR